MDRRSSFVKRRRLIPWHQKLIKNFVSGSTWRKHGDSWNLYVEEPQKTKILWSRWRNFDKNIHPYEQYRSSTQERLREQQLSRQINQDETKRRRRTKRYEQRYVVAHTFNHYWSSLNSYLQHQLLTSIPENCAQASWVFRRKRVETFPAKIQLLTFFNKRQWGQRKHHEEKSPNKTAS